MSEISRYFGTIVDKKEKKPVKSNFLGKNREGFYFVTNVNTRFLKCTHSHTTIKITSKQTMKEGNIYQLRQSKLHHKIKT